MRSFQQGMQNLKVMLFRALGCMVLGGAIAYYLPIIVVTSESVECKVVIPVPFKPAKENYVLIKHPNYEKLLVKKIIAIEGDSIPQLPLEPSFEALKATFIPEGFVFVAGTHPKSFDSRYEAFGLIKTSDIKSVVFTLY